MPLNIDTSTYHRIDYHDLDSFVAEIYNRDFSFVAAVESSNDVTHEIFVNGNIDEWERKEFDDWKNGEPESYGTPCSIMNDLAARGLIPMGDYLIRVSW